MVWYFNNVYTEMTFVVINLIRNYFENCPVEEIFKAYWFRLSTAFSVLAKTTENRRQIRLYKEFYLWDFHDVFKIN